MTDTPIDLDTLEKLAVIPEIKRTLGDALKAIEALPALIAEVKRLRDIRQAGFIAGLRKGRREGLMAAAKLQCSYCREGWPWDGWHTSRDGTQTGVCHAAATRAALADKEPQP